MVLIGSIIVGAFFIATIGSLNMYLKMHPSQAEALDFNKKCVDEVPDLESELETGLSVVMDVFPDSAADLRQNKRQIIEQIASLEDPPKKSPLWKIRLIKPRQWLKKLMNVFGNTRGNSTQRLEVENNHTRRLRDGVCEKCVAEFIMVLIGWVANWAMMTIPDENKFRQSLEDFASKAKPLTFDGQVEAITNFALSEGAAKKTTALFRLMKKILALGNYPVMLLMHWINDNSPNIWKSLSILVKFAAQLAMTFGQNATRLAGAVAYQIMAIPDMVESGKEVVSACGHGATTSLLPPSPLIAA
jgi:hypothetical protein